ncbi:AMP-binding protein [Alteromonas sp. A079]|uniref:AMP-binding protein n=1 Tax=Alteromonas sp. A079 TaxID=3410268 RepID=UPI003BA04A48
MMLDESAYKPDDIALTWNGGNMSYQALASRVEQVSQWMCQREEKHIALLADNSADWVICDLAAREAGKVLTPVPVYFSEQQRAHLFDEAGIELVVTDNKQTNDSVNKVVSPFETLHVFKVNPSRKPCIPVGTGKITFTSGSTGQPKGVCLSNLSQYKVAKNLSSAVGLKKARHLCLLPLPTLLENIAGVYTPLLVGGTVVLPSSNELGFTGAALNNPSAMLYEISLHEPETLILVPELLLLLVSACRNGWVPPSSLTFIAVGGAHVAPALLESASEFGLPVYQGYGLSEAVSVNTLNLPSRQRNSSVGVSLGHNQLSVEDGELVVKGNIFLGYLNQPDSFYPSQVNTGDVVSQEGTYFYVHGRKKNIIITSLGRNISPEWVESALTATGFFRYALLVGEGQKACSAILIKRDQTISAEQVENAVVRVNENLPEYARITNWHTLDTLPANASLLTNNGKLRRTHALAHFQSIISNFNHYSVA